MQILLGLNESYSQIQGQILLIDPLPSINKVYSLLIQDERQKSIGHSAKAYVESIALSTKINILVAMVDLEILMGITILVEKPIRTMAKKGQCVVTVEHTILWKSAISFMDILLDTRPKERN